MAVYALRRLVYSAVVLVGLLVVVFLMTNLVGDPARLILPPDSTPAAIAAEHRQLGLERPLMDRLLQSVSQWLRGDFGNSLWANQPAMPLALSRLPYTALLALATMAISVPGSILLGFASALKPDSLLDRVLTSLSLTGVSIPSFWLALMLILVFAVDIRIFPTSGFQGPWSLVLPAVTIAIIPTARIGQIVRSSLRNELEQPYVLTARSKGLNDAQVIAFHALRNAIIPAITITGVELANFLNGEAVVGTIFGYPSLGPLFLQAIENRDLPLIEACVALGAVSVIVVNFVIDLLYPVIDHRLTLNAQHA